jgi:hypothetical protein
MQVLLLLAIEGSPGVMARRKLNDMTTKLFLDPHDPCLETSNAKRAALGFRPWVLVYLHRFKGMHLKLTEQSHRCGAALVVSMMGSYKKEILHP